MLGPGISSESIWTAFATTTTAFMRILKWSLNISWKRAEDPNAGFAIVGTSLVSGTDIVKGLTSAVSNLDTFQYFDESERVVGMDYERVLHEPLGGISTAIMKVELDNTDQRFTPDKNSTIGTAILPKRPINAHIGFRILGQDKTVTVFKGLTKQPKENKMRRSAEIIAIDYVEFLLSTPMDSKIYTNQRSDQIISDILATLGFGTSQYELDTGLNTIGYASFSKGVSAGERIKQLCEAEEAVFYQDPEGVLRFENRRHYSVAPYNASVHNIEASDIMEWEQLESTKLINSVVVKSRPRTVRSSRDIWQNAGELELEASASVIVWASFEDPVTAVTTPASGTDYTAFTATGGGGSDITSDIDIVMNAFSEDAKLTITNNNASKAYINLLKLRGTPATYIDDQGVSSEIIETYEDATSIDKYDEQILTIENDLITDKDFAQTLAQHVVNKYKTPNRQIKLTVQGIPHLELRDYVQVQDLDLV